jgi:hypothetical protein
MKKDGLWNVKTTPGSVVPRYSAAMAVARKCRRARFAQRQANRHACLGTLLFLLKSRANLRKYPPFFASEFQCLPRKLPPLAFYQPR